MSWEAGLTMSFWLTAQSCDSVFPVAWQLHVITKKLILSWNRLDMVIYVGRYSCSGKTILFLVSVSVSRFHMMNCSTSPVGCILPKKVKSDSALERDCAEKKRKPTKPPTLLFIRPAPSVCSDISSSGNDKSFIPVWIQCGLERWKSIIIVYTITVPKSCWDLPKTSPFYTNIKRRSSLYLNSPCSFFCVGNS